MSDQFADDIPLVRWNCLFVAKDTHKGKSASQVIAAAKEYEKYVLPKAVSLKMVRGKQRHGE